MSYPRCSFKSVVDDVLAMAGQSAAQLDATQKLQLHGFVNDALRDWAWIAWPWSHLVKTELRRYRAPYSSATTYAAPTATAASEVYFPATKQYYQALRSTLDHAPATATNGVYSTNEAYWAVAGGPYSGPDWEDATAYAVGDVVRSADNDRYYACHTAHTSSGSLDATKFGILTVFDPYVSRTQSWETNEIGTFLAMYLDNPQTTRRPRRVEFKTDNLGAHVLGAGHWGGALYSGGEVPHEVYVYFRDPAPNFSGSVFAALSTYAAGDVVYYEGTGQDYAGDYWECTATTTAGQDPEDTPAKWTRLEFPEWLKSAVAKGAFCDWLRGGANRESARAEEQAADGALYQAQLLDGAQQGQVLRWRKSA